MYLHSSSLTMIDITNEQDFIKQKNQSINSMFQNINLRETQAFNSLSSAVSISSVLKPKSFACTVRYLNLKNIKKLHLSVNKNKYVGHSKAFFSFLILFTPIKMLYSVQCTVHPYLSQWHPNNTNVTRKPPLPATLCLP